VGNGPPVVKAVPILVGIVIKTKMTSKTKNMSRAGKTIL
jgi:hypothetical protein